MKSGSRHVLIIDDEESNLEVLGAMIQFLGHVPVYSRDGEAGIGKLSTEIDLVLLDLMMPDMDGFEVLQWIRAREEFANLPIIVVTAMSSREDRLMAIELGASDFIVKPVDRTELCVRMNSLIKMKEAQDAIKDHQLKLEKIIEARTAELRESEERYALAVRGANDGLWDWNLKKDEIYFSPRWKQMLGCEEEEIEGTSEAWFARVHQDDINKLKHSLENHLSGVTSHFENEHRILHQDNTYRWMLCRGLAVRDEDGKATRIAGSQSDITARKDAEEQLRHDAFHDSLTGLPNRSLFMDRLERALERFHRNQEHKFAVLFLDLDRFKNVNDGLGHMAGDELLMEVSRRLQVCVRSVDTVARFGGDEFAILLEEIDDYEDAVRVAERINQELETAIAFRGNEMFTSVSVGIALSELTYEQPEEMIRDADIAMYRAKASGRACYETFNKGMHKRVVALLELENDLRRAVERNEFLLHYQPIVDLRTGMLDGFEALIRWQHPEKGLVRPDRFIPIAEDTGLIIPMGWWALQEACGQLRSWRENFPNYRDLSVNVNLSVKQVSHVGLFEQVQEALRESGVQPSNLKLELTESALMESPEQVKELLEQLRGLGIHVCMDDFGTGYSSLSYLHNFPFDTLKIDRSFIWQMGGSVKNQKIVRTIVSLAHDLGLHVVAEGVETQEHLTSLCQLQCNLGQGYFFARPLSAKDAERLLVEKRTWALEEQ